MKYFAASDGSSVAYKIVGTGRPIVFIHGWSVDHRLWFNKIEAMRGGWKRRYQRVYFDLPGMGKSIGAKTIANSDHMLRNIMEFIDFTIGKGNFLLAGESYGGYLARGLLARRSERIDGLFLLCPLAIPGYRKGIVSARIVLERDDRFLSSVSDKDRVEFDYLSVIQNGKMWKDYKKDIHLERLAENAGFLERQLDSSFTDEINLHDIAYDKPILLLLGRQDSEVGFEQQYDLYRGCKRATIMVLDKAGHNLQIERRDLLRSAFLDLIERVETPRLGGK
jgi:pimeloyl-ACP methyl ester carboxylesterase